MAKYLDYSGLSKYDELIKALIKSGNESLIAKINEIAGGSDVDMSLADVVSLIGDVKDGETLKGLIDALEAIVAGDESVDGSVNARLAELKSAHETDIKNLTTAHNKDIEYVKSLIAEIAGVDSDAAEGLASMAEIVDSIKNLQTIVGAKYADSDSDEDSVIDRLDALENGSVYVPSQALQSNTDLESNQHGGLGSHNAAWFAAQGYTMNDMFDMILFPTVMPVLSEPSVSWKGFSSRNVEVGSDITAYVISSANVDDYLSYNYGSWSLDANSGMAASNGHQTPTLNRTNVPAKNAEDKYIIAEKTATFKANVMFDAGDAPKDNKGNEHPELAYAGGTKSTSIASLTPYYNWYATTEEAGVLSVQSVISGAGIGNASTSAITLMPHSAAGKQAFKLPKALKTYQQFDDATSKWVAITLDDESGWVMTSASEDYNGVKHTFYTYTYEGKDRSSIQIKLTF